MTTPNALTAMIVAAKLDAADAELTKVVAWLRDGCDAEPLSAPLVRALADALERHAHRKETR